jgi:hypothetical protein
MNHKAGIWIDHKKAVVVSASASGVTASTVESEVGPHTRYSGPQDGGGEKHYEARHDQHLDRPTTRSSPCWATGGSRSGPGEAKLQLKERLRRSRRCLTVSSQTTDKLTDPQIIAK